jgi:hypothetical protein
MSIIGWFLGEIFMYTYLEQNSFYFFQRWMKVSSWAFKLKRRANILVNISTFLQFLLHISMWCHFNGMSIMESCAYSLIWIWRNVKCVKKLPISRFGWNKWYLIAPFNDTTFTKGPLVFIIQFFNANLKKVIGYY